MDDYNYNAGDKVIIETDKEKLEGIVLKRAELFSDDTIVIKLKNGYNIGIKKDKIKDVEVVEKYNDKKSIEGYDEDNEAADVPYDKNKPTVSILSFGGTISSKIDYRTGGVYADDTAKDFVAMMPELKDIANIKARKVLNIMSEDMVYEDWKVMAEEVVKELNNDEVDGIVVTQGTDTLHFSSAALSFFLRDLNKPVVFTAAQRSIDRGSSDAYFNLLCAVRTAVSDIAEVTVCMHETSDDKFCSVIRGTKVRKMHTSRRDAFRAVNDTPLARVNEQELIILRDDYNKKNNGETKLNTNFDDKCALLYVYPNMDPEVIDYYINSGYKGIVIGATALGHVNTRGKKSLLPYLKKAYENNVIIVIASQTLYGRVHPYVYSNLRKLSIEAKAIYVEDMMPEVAYIKLSWVLGNTKRYAKEFYDTVKQLMRKNIAHEITERSIFNQFLN